MFYEIFECILEFVGVTIKLLTYGVFASSFLVNPY